MKSSKPTGRPPTGRKGRPLQLYATDDFIAAVDEWAKQQEGKAPNRSEAIRRLASLALDAEAKKRGRK